MPRYNLSELYVVTYRSSRSYDFDTGTPDEIFSTREEAEAQATRLNGNIPLSPAYGIRYVVETLDERLDTIRSECRNEGESRGDDRI